MFLHVMTNGAKYWRLKYRFSGKEKLLSMGVYPAISLAEARSLCDEAKALLRSDRDPGLVKQLKKNFRKNNLKTHLRLSLTSGLKRKFQACLKATKLELYVF